MTETKTVAGYLAGLPPERRREIAKVRSVVKKHLPKGYRESMGYGGITWSVPLSVYADTYNGEPLCYVALANQKHYASLYLMIAYGSPVQLARLKEGFRRAGKKLDMGKSCVRFRAADDLDLDTVAEVIASTPMGKYVEIAEMAHAGRNSRKKEA